MKIQKKSGVSSKYLSSPFMLDYYGYQNTWQ